MTRVATPLPYGGRYDRARTWEAYGWEMTGQHGALRAGRPARHSGDWTSPVPRKGGAPLAFRVTLRAPLNARETRATGAAGRVAGDGLAALGSPGFPAPAARGAGAPPPGNLPARGRASVGLGHQRLPAPPDPPATALGRGAMAGRGGERRASPTAARRCAPAAHIKCPRYTVHATLHETVTAMNEEAQEVVATGEATSGREEHDIVAAARSARFRPIRAYVPIEPQSKPKSSTSERVKKCRDKAAAAGIRQVSVSLPVELASVVKQLAVRTKAGEGAAVVLTDLAHQQGANRECETPTRIDGPACYDLLAALPRWRRALVLLLLTPELRCVLSPSRSREDDVA